MKNKLRDILFRAKPQLLSPEQGDCEWIVEWKEFYRNKLKKVEPYDWGQSEASMKSYYRDRNRKFQDYSDKFGIDKSALKIKQEKDSQIEQERQSILDFINAWGVEKVKRKRVPSYAKYLKSETWRQKRNSLLKEYGCECEICGEDNEHLAVHHNTYQTYPFESDDDLIILCKSCHCCFHKSVPGKELTHFRFNCGEKIIEEEKCHLCGIPKGRIPSKCFEVFGTDKYCKTLNEHIKSKGKQTRDIRLCSTCIDIIKG